MHPDVGYTEASNVLIVQPSTHFFEQKCTLYFWSCCCSSVGLLILAFLIGLTLPPFGLIVAALTPTVIILILVRSYYRDQVTAGQMTLTFLEAILWMIPLTIWDFMWRIAVQSHLKDRGLCSLCILGYFLNSYFIAGFLEEVVKYLAICRLQNSLLTPDFRCLMVYGVCAGAGFATVENLFYVLSSDFSTAIVRAFTSVPLHCLTGCLIGLELARQKFLNASPSFLRVIAVPWFLHGTYDFILTMGANSRRFAPAAPALWLLVYIAGLVYARRVAMGFYKAYPPPILAQRRISQWGRGTDWVCECCPLSACCCHSSNRNNPPSFQFGIFSSIDEYFINLVLVFVTFHYFSLSGYLSLELHKTKWIPLFNGVLEVISMFNSN
eukprot:gene2752-5420_t